MAEDPLEVTLVLFGAAPRNLGSICGCHEFQGRSLPSWEGEASAW